MNNQKGFSLIELMIALGILALIITYALPNYRQYVLRSKRVEAQNKLLEIGGLFEKHYANTNAYPGALVGGGDGALSLTTNYLNWEDYAITLGAGGTGGGWVLTATAINTQTEDTDCPTINFNNLGQKTPLICWE